MNEEIKDNRSTRENNRRQLNKQRKPPLDDLENHMRREERHAGVAMKRRVKLT